MQRNVSGSSLHLAASQRNKLLTASSGRFRLLTTLVPEPTDNIFSILAKAGQVYPPIYQRLIAGEPVTCAVKGTVFEALPAPVAIIMDFFALAELQATRSITGDTVPVVAIVASGAAPIIQLFGPERIGGLGDLGAKVDAEVARTGRDPIEVGEEVRDTSAHSKLADI